MEISKMARQKENDGQILLKMRLMGDPKNSKDEKWENWDY